MITGVWKFYRCVEAKEIYCTSTGAAEPVDWGSNQSTGGVPSGLCMLVHRHQSTDCTVQSTGYFPESFGSRLGLKPVDWPCPRISVHLPVHRSSRLLIQCSRLGGTARGF